MAKRACTFAATDTKQRLQQLGMTFPRELTLAITSRCNLRCCHCWPESGPDVDNSHVPFEHLHHVITQWHGAGLTQLCITGGEPFVHPQWQKILASCCDMPSIDNVRLQSNGTLITKEIVDHLLLEQYQKVTLQISLDGCRPEEHDRIRGEGSFTKTLTALRLLKQKGLSTRVTISFTETIENFDQLPQLLGFIDNLHISSLTSNTLIRGGRAANDFKLSMPTPEQYVELLRRYEQDVEFRKLYDLRANISAIEWYRYRDTQGRTDTCSCIATPYINAQGQLYPCTLIRVPGLAIDNVWGKSLDQVLDEIENKWAPLHDLSRKRPTAIHECRNCTVRNHCQSGCLGRSFSYTGNFLQPEDRCLHRKAVYNWGKTSKCC